MLLGALFIPSRCDRLGAVAPVPFDARSWSCCWRAPSTGLFVFHGLGLWATIYGPRRGDYNQSFGNDLSLVGNIVVIGGVMALHLRPADR